MMNVGKFFSHFFCTDRDREMKIDKRKWRNRRTIL